MSVADMNIEMTIAHIVEAMLPRSSDSKLGLFFDLKMETNDFGYGEDGNTLERERQTHRKNLLFLFVRPSNYTKVFLFEPEEFTYSMSCEERIWNMESDHDSCWRTDGFNRVTDVHFELCAPICKARGCAPKDVDTWHSLNSDPKYVELEVAEQADKTAERYSKESRAWRIKMKDIGFNDLVQHKYQGKNLRGDMQDFFTGMFIKDGERDQQFRKNRDLTS